MTFSLHHSFVFVVSLLFALLCLRVNAVTDSDRPVYSTSSADPSSLIAKICSQTTDSKLCYQVLSPHGRPAASDLPGLARVLLTSTKNSVQNAYKLVTLLLKDAKDPKVKKPLGLCLGDYNDAVSNLNSWEKFFASGSYNKLEVTAVSVSVQPVYCDQNFVASKVTEPSQLKAASSNLQGLCSILQVISTSLAGN